MENDYSQSSAVPVQNPRDELRKKVSAAFEVYLSDWKKMSPTELIGSAEEVYTVTQMAGLLCDVIPEKDAAYLLRFKNPLEVVSDHWRAKEIMKSGLIAEEMRLMVWHIRHRSDAETDYEPAGDRMENSMEEMI